MPDAVDYVLLHGHLTHRTGIRFFFLRRCDIPPADRRHGWCARLVGTVVLVAPEGDIITVYRNRHALPVIRRKPKYRLVPAV